MKISHINGLCVKNDAISNSIRDEITWLSIEDLYDVRLYAYDCDYKDIPFTKVSDLKDIAFDQHFQSSEFVIFHFGIFYPLFNVLPLSPMSAKRLVVFHNITPKQFTSEENHTTIDKSFNQMANIMFADHVVCDSLTNLDVLRSAGIQTPATVLPLAIHAEFKIPESKPSAADELIRIAFIGRFVQSKGPGELLDALYRVLQRNHSARFELDMIGNLSFSDSQLLENIRKKAEAMQRTYSSRAKVTIHGDATEEIKLKTLGNADLFVLPTYHEGFCVPIVEAIANGCKVIAYDNSNTPAIAGGLATLTPTGNVESLSFAISEAFQEITSSQWLNAGHGSYTEYRQIAWQYVQQYSPERTKQRFLSFIKNFTNTVQKSK